MDAPRRIDPFSDRKNSNTGSRKRGSSQGHFLAAVKPTRLGITFPNLRGRRGGPHHQTPSSEINLHSRVNDPIIPPNKPPQCQSRLPLSSVLPRGELYVNVAVGCSRNYFNPSARSYLILFLTSSLSLSLAHTKHKPHTACSVGDTSSSKHTQPLAHPRHTASSVVSESANRSNKST